MASFVTILALLLSISKAIGNNDDQFSYKFRSRKKGKLFGLKEWNEVSCDSFGQCLGWPDKYESRRSFNLTDNHCRWCPAQGGPNCTHHRQSPINLERNKGIKGHKKENICKDGHWMAYLPGSCKWQDIIDNDSSQLRNNFVVNRHALQIKQPLNAAGKLQCERKKFPRIDFAFGFPEWWLLYQTEIKTPSEHFQEGKQYDAEIQLDHVYQINRRQREIGKVAIFMDGNATAKPWDYLDKLICQWREVEEETRKECCLDSVPAYPGCRNPARPACAQGDSDSVLYPVNDVKSTTEPTRVDIQTSVRYNFNSRPDRPGLGRQNATASERTAEEPQTTTMTTTTLSTKVSTSTERQRTQATMRPTTPITSTVISLDVNVDDSQTFSCESYPYINLERMCKDGGCCEDPRQDGGFCHKVYDVFGSDTALACQRCCDSPKTVGPPAPEHDEYARIECSTIPDDTARMCKAGGCCDGSDGDWCKDLRAIYSSDEMQSICWYCCSEPRDIGKQRGFWSGVDVASEGKSPLTGHLNEIAEPEHHDVLDDSQRNLKTMNFRHVPYHAYEWMHKVNTEYYFRYVGSQSVPPCFTRVHWRVMKDPIQVHPMQIAELQRLLAWRIASKDAKFNACQKDTAGRRVPGSNGNAVDVSRPLQAENPLHQITFCECKDWTSKSLKDQAWCNITSVNKRFYDHPYSFDTDGLW